MARIRGRDTGPELRLRAALRRAGLTGYRLHRRRLPGRPDIAFGRVRLAVFVDGDFWHGRDGVRLPDSWFWRQKVARNRLRDHRADQALLGVGWLPLRVWASDVERDPDGVAADLAAVLRLRGYQLAPARKTVSRGEVSGIIGS